MRTKNAARITPAESAHLAAVPSLPCVYASTSGEIYSNLPSARWGGNQLRKLRPCDNGRGYLRVKCHGKMRSVHKLVSLAWHGPANDGFEVNHLDGNKLNNRPENLEYTTRSGNMQHAREHGLRRDRTGDENPRSVISNDQATSLLSEYKALLSSGIKAAGKVGELAARYGVRRDYPRDLYMGRVRRGVRH